VHRDLDRTVGWAPRRRIVQEVPNGPGDPDRVSRHDARHDVDLDRRVRRAAFEALDVGTNHLIQANVLELGRLLGTAGELDDVVDDGCEVLQLHPDVGDQQSSFGWVGQAAAREQVDVGANAGQWRPELVRGIGDELPLFGDRTLQRAEHLVEPRGKTPDLVLCTGLLDPKGQIAGLAHALGGVGQAGDRRRSRAGDRHTEPDRERHAGGDQDHQHHESPQRVVDLAQRTRQQNREPLSDRGEQDPVVDAVCIDVAKRRLVPEVAPDGDPERGPVGRTDHLAVGGDDLEHERRPARFDAKARLIGSDGSAILSRKGNRASNELSTWALSSRRTTNHVTSEAVTTAIATAAADATVSRCRKVTTPPSRRSRPRGPCG
jgi:hypothetical protein